MRIQLFIVELNNPIAVYRPGEEISGNVILRLAKSIRARGLRLNIVGESFSRWEFGKKSTTSSNTSYVYKDHEKYIDFKQTLLGKDEHDTKAKNVSISKGEHTFQFRFQLPEGGEEGKDLPTSLEGAYGYVRYCVRVVIDRPMKRNQWTLKPFTVVRVLDLNQEPSAQEPATATINNKVRSKSCVCRTGLHNLSLEIDRSGFCPGEALFINAKCENGTSRKVLRTSVDLLQVINYSGSKKPLIGGVQKKTRRTMKIVQTVRGEGCGGHSIVHWKSVPMVVPPIPPSRLDGCGIIDVQYLVRFTVYLKNSKRLFCEVPVLVGTEPLTSSYYAYYGESMNCVVDRSTSVSSQLNQVLSDNEKEAAQTSLSANDSAKNDPNNCMTPTANAPATYEECIYGGATLTDDEYTMGQTVFVPLYRVYHTLRHQSTAIQAYGRASIVVEDISPYRPIGVSVSVQASDLNIAASTPDDEEDFEDDHSDPLMYGGSNGENENSEVSVHPSPNGEWIPERPLEPIMFEVHHTGDSFAPSAAESPQMMVYQSQSSQLANCHETVVLETVKTYKQTSVESHTVEVSHEVQITEQNESLAVEKPDDFSDSEFEDGNESTADKQEEAQALEPEKPRPMFSSEQVIISYEDDQPMIQPLENEEALTCEINEEEFQDDEDAHLLSESQKDEENVEEERPNDKAQTKASAQSLELDSNGLPIGALIPLSGSNETVTSDNTTDDQPASEVFQDEPPREPEPVETNVCVIPNNYMMERLEISTEMNSDRITITEHYMNGDQSVNYEPTLQIAPCVPAEQYQNEQQNEFQMLNGSISETPRISQSDAGTDQASTFMEDHLLEQDYLPNGTGNSTLEELSVDTNAPVDFDSTEAEFHSGSSNCAEFLVNSTPVDFSECENVVYVPRASAEIPSPSFPEPIEEVFMPEEEEEQGTEEVQNEVDDVKEDTTTETEEEDTVKVQETRQLESGVTDSLQVDDKTPSSTSSLNDPIIYIATAEEIAQAALVEATTKVAEEEQSQEAEPEPEPEVTRNSVHFNVEEEPQPSLEEKSPDKLSFVDDVNTTESDDKTSYDNTGLEEELLDYDETARSLDRTSSSETYGNTETVDPQDCSIAAPPLANLDPIKGIFESESEPSIDMVLMDQPKETNEDEEEAKPEEDPNGQVIQNMSVSELPEDNNDLMSQMPPPMVPLFNPAHCPPPPVQPHFSEDTSSEDEDDEGLSAIEEEPSSITQDGEDDTPPPIPDRAMVPPPIPQRVPAAELDQFAIPDVSVSVEDTEQLMFGCTDEPLSPITEKCGEETADEASPSIFAEKKESQFMCDDPVMSDSGSYDVNESESGANETTESSQVFGDTHEVDAMLDREMIFGNDPNEGLEPPVLPEREPVTPEDDIYISYGPGVSGTLVSEHAENDDYDIDDLIGPGPGNDAPPVDRSQKPQLRHSGSRDDDSSPCHIPSEVSQQMTSQYTENGSYSFDDEDGLHMVQGSYPDDDEAPGHYGSTGGGEGEEESVGERGESSDDVEERDCFGGAEGLESGDRTEDSAEADSEEPEKPNMAEITCENPEEVQLNQHCDTEV